MPNWVVNDLKFEGHKTRVDELIKLVKIEDNEFDFNAIIPMPDSLNIESGSRGERGYEAYRKFMDESMFASPDERAALERKYKQQFAKDPESWELGKTYYENKAKYGYATWYGWCWDNWGTKWNACNASTEYNGRVGYAHFDTAWNAPDPIIKKLSAMFPDIRIEHRYADEDIGNNLGCVTYLGGAVVESDTPEEGSEEAIRFACEMWGYDYDEYMDENQY